MKNLGSLIILIILLATACESSPDLNKETTAMIYVDRLFLKEKYGAREDSLVVKLDSMFLSYNTTQAVFDSSMRYYMSNDKRLDEFFDIADAYVDSLKVNPKR